MKKNFYTIILWTIIVLILAFPYNSQAQRTKSSLNAGEQRSAEKGLKDNRYFFYFINASITNLGNPDEKKLFKEAIQRDMLSQMLYMKFNFADSFAEIRKAQHLLIQLYRQTLTKDIANTVNLLKSFAPKVIKTKQYKAKHYLRLGFRDAAMAKIEMGMADNFQENLYSMRLYEYVKAIKNAKHGKRYAFYAALEARTPDKYKNQWGLLGFKKINDLVKINPSLALANVEQGDQKPLLQRIYELQDLDEKKAKLLRIRKNLRDGALINETENRIKKIKEELIAIEQKLEQKYPEYTRIKEKLSTIHYDNYYKPVKGISFYDQVWKEPMLHELKEYNEYMQKK